jgi:hypothetical protein
VVDLHDPAWPVIRRMDSVVAARLGPAVQLAETRAFFAPRATSWEQQFPDDDPAYAAAVAELGLRPGQTALDAGCGTGRALPHLRATVGQTGHVLGFDLTPEMLATARRHGRHAHALLVLAAACRCPPAASTAASPPGCCPTFPIRARAWPPWPPATAGACARTTCSPPTRSAVDSSAPAGGWPATTTGWTGSWPSPSASPRDLDLLLRLVSRVGRRRRPARPAPRR